MTRVAPSAWRMTLVRASRTSVKTASATPGSCGRGPVSVRATASPVRRVVSRTAARSSQPWARPGSAGGFPSAAPTTAVPVPAVASAVVAPVPEAMAAVAASSGSSGPGRGWRALTALRVSARPSRARALTVAMASSSSGSSAAPARPSVRAMMAVRECPTESWSSPATRAWRRAASRCAMSRCSAAWAASRASPCSRASRRDREIAAAVTTTASRRISGVIQPMRGRTGPITTRGRVQQPKTASRPIMRWAVPAMANRE